MVEHRASKDKLFVSFYLNGDNTIILAGGVPSYVTKHHPIVQFCQEHKLNLFIPRYPGSFESEGDFSLAACTDVLEKTVSLVKAEQVKTLYQNKVTTWKAGKIVIIGFSFGALPALLADVQEASTVLVCPFTNLKLNDTAGGGAREELHFIERAYPHVYRFKADTLLKEYEHIQYPPKKQFTLIAGKKDATLSKSEISFLQEKYHPDFIEFDSGHTLHLESVFTLLKKRGIL